MSFINYSLSKKINIQEEKLITPVVELPSAERDYKTVFMKTSLGFLRIILVFIFSRKTSNLRSDRSDATRGICC